MSKIKLYAHQRDDLAFLMKHDQGALFHEVGSGKTYPLMMRIALILAENPTKCGLLVAEVQLLEQLRREWMKVAPEFQPIIITGKTKKSMRQLIMRNPPPGRLIIMNYDFMQQAEAWLMSLPLIVVWCDEAHRLKGFRGVKSKYGKRAKVLMRVAYRCHYRYASTGSPLVNPNRPDVWGLYYFLDKEIFGPVVWRFEKEFFWDVSKSNKFKKLLLKDGMKEEMSRRMYLIARRLLVDELPVDFPDVVEMPYFVEMPSKVRTAYQDLKLKAIASLGGEVVTRPMMLGRLMSLQQISSGFCIEHKSVLEQAVALFDDPENQDLLALMEGLESKRKVLHLDSSHKDQVVAGIFDSIGNASTIIWAHFTHEIDHLCRLVRDIRGEAPSRVDGKVTGDARQSALDRFTGGEVGTLVAHPGAAGAGLNLHIASDSIRYSRSHQLLHFEQSNGRNRRAGKMLYPFIRRHEIVTLNSTDEDVYNALKLKKDIASEITLDFLGTERNS